MEGRPARGVAQGRAAPPGGLFSCSQRGVLGGAPDRQEEVRHDKGPAPLEDGTGQSEGDFGGCTHGVRLWTLQYAHGVKISRNQQWKRRTLNHDGLQTIGQVVRSCGSRHLRNNGGVQCKP